MMLGVMSKEDSVVGVDDDVVDGVNSVMDG